MRNFPTVSIGICAYNEEKNILHLLQSLFLQRGAFQLIEIFVVSDGSTDRTVEYVRTISDRRIHLIRHVKRLGKISGCNEIARRARGDILILLDADVLPSRTNFVERIITPIVKDIRIGLVGADNISLRPRTFFEKVISLSHEYKQAMYKKINSGNNLYLCHGRARAFRKEFYATMKWINNVPEDSQSYLSCIKKGFLFQFEPKAVVKFRSPATFSDHAKQSTRFSSGKKSLERYFSADMLRKEYHIPKKLLMRFVIRFFFKDSLAMIVFLLTRWYLSVAYFPHNTYTVLWTISSTSKTLEQKNQIALVA